ncbi:larval cuticle protein A3A-like [Anoplophora glabripennis]|uniref:larval cuticle protein A3A-like n=1 Tax=Anoplophora glabripennis TaxID=217634 RepID=UPI000874A61D|nr:larval cuticle protein A3A-like [Anoplophora glabripennis]
MAAKFIAFAALVAVARGSGIVSAPVARAVVAEPYDPNPQYSYGYEVQDPLTGDSHGQVETRSGDVVQGSYALLDSDGTRRQVDYTADPINGFNAVVSKQPVAVAVPAVAKVAAPIAPVAPVLRAAPLAAAPIAPVAPVLRAAPLAAAPIAPVAPWLHSAPLAAAPLLRSAPFAAAPLAPYASVLRSAPLAAAPIAPIATPWAAPVVRSAPLW